MLPAQNLPGTPTAHKADKATATATARHSSTNRREAFRPLIDTFLHFNNKTISRPSVGPSVRRSLSIHRGLTDVNIPCSVPAM